MVVRLQAAVVSDHFSERMSVPPECVERGVSERCCVREYVLHFRCLLLANDITIVYT